MFLRYNSFDFLHEITTINLTLREKDSIQLSVIWFSHENPDIPKIECFFFNFVVIQSRFSPKVMAQLLGARSQIKTLLLF